MLTDAFDGKMVYAMKVILSYYERKQDRILSDYLYYLSIPLMVHKLIIFLNRYRKLSEIHIILCTLQSIWLDST